MTIPTPSTASPVPLLAPKFRLPQGFQWGDFTAADGAKLRWGHLAASRPRVDVVLVGGFSEFVEKYFETIADLAAAGFNTWCLDWRGQGGSERPARDPTRPRARNFDRDAADLATFAKTLPATTRPRLLLAHSMGGAIGLLALAQHPGVFQGAVLSAPMLGVVTDKVPRPVARLLARIGVALGFGDTFAPGRRRWQADPRLSAATSLTSHDGQRTLIEQSWFLALPGLRVDDPTFGWVDAALAVTSRVSDPALLRGIATPLLMGIAGEESFVDPDAAEQAAKTLPDCAVMRFPDARHELFLELDAIRSRWLKAITDFAARFPMPVAQPAS